MAGITVFPMFAPNATLLHIWLLPSPPAHRSSLIQSKCNLKVPGRAVLQQKYHAIEHGSGKDFRMHESLFRFDFGNGNCCTVESQRNERMFITHCITSLLGTTHGTSSKCDCGCHCVNQIQVNTSFYLFCIVVPVGKVADYKNVTSRSEPHSHVRES